MIAPETGRCRGGDGDAALLLLRHPVHRRRALMDLADLVDLLGVEEDALGDRGLAGIDVGDDADVACLREGDVSGHVLVPALYHLKWLKARFASAILWVSSRRLTAAPRPFMASTSSVASFSDMLLPERLRAAWTIQRTPRLMRRSPRISTGTWYVAPPTRRGLTSMIGVALRNAASSTSRPGRLVAASARASAWRRMRSARPFLPFIISLTTMRSVVRDRTGAYLSLRAG